MHTLLFLYAIWENNTLVQVIRCWPKQPLQVLQAQFSLYVNQGPKTPFTYFYLFAKKLQHSTLTSQEYVIDIQSFQRGTVFKRQNLTSRVSDSDV